MIELDNTNEYEKKDIVLSAVQFDNVLSSNSTYSSDCTAEGGIDLEKRRELKLFLKDLALKIIKETYEEHRKNSSPLH